MKKKIIALIEFIFYIVEYWVRLTVFIFTSAWGCRKQKFSFLNII